MSDRPSLESSPPKTPLTTAQIASRFALIGFCVAIPVLAFGYAGGWLDATRVSADKLVNILQVSGGDHPGFRRNHAKGVCTAGYFEGNGALAPYSTAGVFANGRTPVIGRLAIPGGNPFAPDSSVPIRSMALRFDLPDGQQWRTGMNNVPLFPVATPEAFYALQLATAPDAATGKPDGARVKTFFGSHPEAAPFITWLKGTRPSARFDNDAFYSVNAFVLIDAAGKRHPVRWAMTPDANNANNAAIKDAPKDARDYLEKNLDDRLAQGPVQWHLVFTFAEPGDILNDATVQWPAGRRTVDAGVLTLTGAQPQSDGPCRDINYDPTVLPTGIKVSEDPLLAARSSAYAVSYKRRTGEESTATASSEAVSPDNASAPAHPHAN